MTDDEARHHALDVAVAFHRSMLNTTDVEEVMATVQRFHDFLMDGDN